MHVCVLRHFANFHYDINEIENIFIKKFYLLAICIVAICLAEIQIEVVSIAKYGMNIKEFNYDDCLKMWYAMYKVQGFVLIEDKLFK